MTTSWPFLAGAVPSLSLGAQSIALAPRILDEASPEGTFVGTLSVLNSADSWLFTLTDDGAGKFAIGLASGLYAGAVATDFSVSPSESVSVSASNGVNTLTADFSITVRSVDTGGPLDDPATTIIITWVDPFISGQVVESAAIGTTIAVLTATPGDPLNQVFSETADTEAKVAVAADGTITLDGALNYALDQTHPFTVTVANALAGQSAGSLIRASAITVLNSVPTFALTWAAGFEGGLIPEGTAPLTTLANALPIDGSGQTYAILADPDGVVTITSNGVLKLETALDGSVSALHSFTIRGTNSAGTFDLTRYLVVESSDTVLDVGFIAFDFRRDALIPTDVGVFYPIYGARNTDASFTATAFNRNAAIGTSTGTFAGTADWAAVDGSPAAPAASIQLPNYFNGKAARPPWHVAGVDYAVGYPTGTSLADWRTLSLPGVSVDVAGHSVHVTSSTPITLNAIDLSLGGGAQIYNTGVGALTVTNSKSVTAGPDSSAASVFLAGEGCGDVTLLNCDIDGRANGSVLAGFIGFHNGPNATLKLRYCRLRMGTVDDVFNVGSASAGQTSVDIKYCLIESGTHTAVQHGDLLQTLGWGTVYPSVVVEFCTLAMQADTGGTQGFMATSNNTPLPTFNYVSFCNNTMDAVAGANLGQAFAVAASMLNGTAQVKDNYIDTTGVVFGWFSPGDSGGPYSGTVIKTGNVDMSTGGALT